MRIRPASNDGRPWRGAGTASRTARGSRATRVGTFPLSASDCFGLRMGVLAVGVVGTLAFAGMGSSKPPRDAGPGRFDVSIQHNFFAGRAPVISPDGR